MAEERGHQFSMYVRVVGYQYCLKCGLIALNNNVTRKALAGRCKGDDVEPDKPKKYNGHGSKR